MFILEDLRHCEQKEFATFELALKEIRHLAQIPWHEEPTRAPCTSWRTCGRTYRIAEFDEPTKSRTLVKSTPIVEIDAKGVRWEPEFEPQDD